MIRTTQGLIQPFLLNLSVTLYEQLREEAYTQRLSMAKVTRAALVDYLTKSKRKRGKV